MFVPRPRALSAATGPDGPGEVAKGIRIPKMPRARQPRQSLGSSEPAHYPSSPGLGFHPAAPTIGSTDGVLCLTIKARKRERRQISTSGAITLLRLLRNTPVGNAASAAHRHGPCPGLCFAIGDSNGPDARCTKAANPVWGFLPGRLGAEPGAPN